MMEPRGTKPSLSEHVYQYLVDGIISGRITYGDTLNIKELAQELAMSPMPIRDAVKRLEGEGIVVVKPRSSCYVRTPSRQDVLQSVEARQMIEVHVVSTIYPRVTTTELEPIARVVEAMRHDIRIIQDHPDGGAEWIEARDRYISLDREFHTLLCRLTYNAYIIKFYRENSLHLNMRFRHDVGRRHPLEQTFQDHEAMLRELRENSPRIITTMEAHLGRSRENIVAGSLFQTLSEQGPENGTERRSMQ